MTPTRVFHLFPSHAGALLTLLSGGMLLSGCSFEDAGSIAARSAAISSSNGDLAACELVQHSDLKTIYGLDFHAPRGMTIGTRGQDGMGLVSSCSWASADADASAVITVVVRQARDAAQARASYEQNLKSGERAGAPARPLLVLETKADQAHYEAGLRQVHVLSGDAWVLISAAPNGAAGDEEAAGSKIALAALARL